MRRLWGHTSKPAAAAETAPGERLYVIGDVHGCSALVARMRALIADDLQRAPHSGALIVFLGDLIDRGLDSAQVIAAVAEGQFAAPVIALRGNHEEMLLTFLEDPQYLESWRHFGGLETLHSFGVDGRKLLAAGQLEAARDALRAALPDAWLSYLMAMPLTHQSGGYFLCHAGVRPGVPLDKQVSRDLLWIRDEFLTSETDHGKLVVHGHTPVEAPEFRRNRINIDTGAYLTGTLTCLVLEGTEQRVLST